MSNFIVLESGATTFQWVLASPQSIVKSGELPGLHPFLTNIKNWSKNLQILTEALQLSQNTPAYYYGTGCGQASGRAIVQTQFEQHSPFLSPLEIKTDLIAAARALCQQTSGVVCILGTGSNTAFYDGQQLTDQRGGFGYMLGDEGSGASLGRILLQAFLYKQLSPTLLRWLSKHHQFNQENIISSLYQSEAPSRLLAQYAPIVHQWVAKDEVLRKQVKDSYRLLAKNCLLPLLNTSNTSQVHFTGSVAFHFKVIIQEVLSEFEIEMGTVLQQPLLKLVQYHQEVPPRR